MDNVGMQMARELLKGGGLPLHIPRQLSGTLFVLQQPVLLRCPEEIRKQQHKTSTVIHTSDSPCPQEIKTNTQNLNSDSHI